MNIRVKDGNTFKSSNTWKSYYVYLLSMKYLEFKIVLFNTASHRGYEILKSF